MKSYTDISPERVFTCELDPEMYWTTFETASRFYKRKHIPTAPIHEWREFVPGIYCCGQYTPTRYMSIKDKTLYPDVLLPETEWQTMFIQAVKEECRRLAISEAIVLLEPWKDPTSDKATWAITSDPQIAGMMWARAKTKGVLI